MAPLRSRKKRRVENQEEDESLVSGSSREGFAECCDVFSSKIAGNPSTSGTLDPFKSTFSMSRKTFNYICSLVKEHMMSKTHFTFTNGNPMSPSEQVALALTRLGSGNSLISIGDSFGAHHSTVSQATWRFVEAIEDKGLPHLLWPSKEELSEIKCKFEKIRGLPNCCGAIGTTRITMLLTSSDLEADCWLDQRGKHSMMLQAVVDPDLKFRSIITGWPGKMSDASVLRSSSLFKQCQRGERLGGQKMFLSSGETELREYIIGDTAYPLLPWLLTPYQGSRLRETKADFNGRLDATHLVVHKALTRLKEAWRMMKGDLWRPDKHRLPRLILVCCILHNIVIDMEKDGDSVELGSDLVHDAGYGREICYAAEETGAVVRDKVCEYLCGR